MSIINEALKKAAREKAPVIRQLEFEHERKRGRWNWGPLFVISVLLLITAPIISPVFSTSFKTEPTPTAPSLTRKGQFAIEEAPRVSAVSPFVASMPNLYLSGIVFSPQDSYCIINEKIVKVGETVSGAKLVRVTPTDATLEFQGNNVVLTATA